MTQSSPVAAASGEFVLGGELTVRRLGFGAMRITGPGIWGPPADPAEAVRVLRRAVELGVTFIDTADSYGPYVSEELIRTALHPYPDDLVIGTKAGFVRTGPNEWHVVGHPKYLRQEVEMSLRRLGVERLDLLQLHRIDPAVPLGDQLGELRMMQQEGKIGLIGLSEVSVEQIQQAREIVDIVSVQNLYNLMERRSADVLDYCAAEGLGFIPWYPIAAGELSGAVGRIAAAHGATPAQVALAWLLARSPVMLPIPGTGSVAHVAENTAAAQLMLTDDELRELSAD
ncbi:aldo/keto reductase [Actinocatenispora comari]|uniref:Oxidoreductase n=1 Tax=Actinocatenispora comari TaxID=2807577 RepID=A0A8J4AMA7_9ACTN|nr:aldo/keto reductase [Actinocatenispora comari]GIL31428.1 oxidoreductase [Actinocatenispora comari]